MIDNYDSFTYNIVQYFGELGAQVDRGTQRRGHAWRTSQRRVDAGQVDRLVVSPGPCSPAEAGISVAAISAFHAGRLPILGVCLGHQSIGAALGGQIIRARPRADAWQDQPSSRPPRSGVFAGIFRRNSP